MRDVTFDPPIPYSELQIWGAGTSGRWKKHQPTFSLVLLQGPEGQIFKPPYQLDDEKKVLLGCDYVFDDYYKEEIAQWVSEASWTQCELQPFETSRVLMYWDDYESPGEVLPLEEAHSRLMAFEKDAIEKGDALFRQRRFEEASDYYAGVAGAVHSAESYARLLLIPGHSERMVEALKGMLAQVAEFDPPSLHVDKVREELDFYE